MEMDIKKKENILIGEDGHVRIADFGEASERRGEGFAGTIGYIVPEIFDGKPYNAAVDWYSFGMTLFSIASGLSPMWCNSSIISTYNLDPHLKDLIEKLLIKTPDQRLGMNGDIRGHPFFRDINWDDLKQLKVTPPFIPKISV
ncbi:hypothetical protein AB205_0049980 [Aquarana catesbeiana]|uniref:Protein kinase domain-containing protein n=1 Tax=Aquarana catesbeiana TaxID=8400 RepID=A0A2G9S2B2_AQUCT|nr:hypothetical protein AB205_0049980 [Aquarana catesbeiana]